MGIHSNNVARLIQLTQGKVAIVDDDDYAYLSRFTWSASIKGDRCYAIATVNGRLTFMHHCILVPRVGFMVDHKDRNGSNNQKLNLRYATALQNTQNQGIKKNNTSGFKGVWFVVGRNEWRARIWVNRKPVDLGRFPTAEAAAVAYNEAAIRYFGEFACLNDVCSLRETSKAPDEIEESSPSVQKPTGHGDSENRSGSPPNHRGRGNHLLTSLLSDLDFNETKTN